jgi:hypothetical protein
MANIIPMFAPSYGSTEVLLFIGGNPFLFVPVPVSKLESEQGKGPRHSYWLSAQSLSKNLN